MQKTQIARSSLAALWQGLVIQGALLLLIVLVSGAGDPFRVYCAAIVAQLVTTGYLLCRRPTEPTRADRFMIRFGIVPLGGIAYFAAPWLAWLLETAGRLLVFD